MVQFDNQSWQVKVKIVYYGPALGGKTTCLQAIHRTVDPERRTKLYSLNTAADRTLFFDLLGLDLGKIRGYRLMMQVYTVPGQVQYRATRQAVLKGADGVVFVADSHPDRRKANIESLRDLWSNLRASGLEKDALPLVIHFNKRDLDRATAIEDLKSDLDAAAVTAFPSVALTGEGVLEGFAAVCEKTLTSVAGRIGFGGSGRALERLRAQVTTALQPYLGAHPVATEPEDVEVTVATTEETENLLESDAGLADQVVQAKLAVGELNTGIDFLRRDLKRESALVREFSDFGRFMRQRQEPSAILQRLHQDVLRLLEVEAAAVATVAADGSFDEMLLNGVADDRPFSVESVAGQRPFIALLEEGVPAVVDRDEPVTGRVDLWDAVGQLGFSSAVVVPLVVHEARVGLLAAFSGTERRSLGEDDLHLAGILSSMAALGLAAGRSVEIGREQGSMQGETSPESAGVGDGPATVERATTAVRVLETALEPLESSVRERRVQLSVRIAPEAEGLGCAGPTTAVALKEIVDNAIRFNREGGEVRVEVSPGKRSGAGQTVVFRVVDSGVGISERDLPKIFDADRRRADPESTSDKRTAGGLVIARKIIESRGGSITVNSWLGRGTEVVVVLPQQ